VSTTQNRKIAPTRSRKDGSQANPVKTRHLQTHVPEPRAQVDQFQPRNTLIVVDLVSMAGMISCLQTGERTLSHRYVVHPVETRVLLYHAVWSKWSSLGKVGNEMHWKTHSDCVPSLTLDATHSCSALGQMRHSKLWARLH
jgi:hypothetical protein